MRDRQRRAYEDIKRDAAAVEREKVDLIKAEIADSKFRAELTRTPRRLRWVRTGYAYQPPALGTYRRRSAVFPQGPAYCTYWVRVPATGVCTYCVPWHPRCGGA